MSRLLRDIRADLQALADTLPADGGGLAGTELGRRVQRGFQCAVELADKLEETQRRIGRQEGRR